MYIIRNEGKRLRTGSNHASGLISLTSLIRHLQGKEMLANALNQRRLRIASRVANINDERNPTVVEHGLCGVSGPVMV